MLLIINGGYGFRGTLRPLKASQEWLISSYPGSAAVVSRGLMTRPVLRNLPLPLPTAYVEAALAGSYFNRTVEGHGPIYLMGARRPLGWWYYFPLVLLLKLPIPTLIFAVLAAMGFVVRLRSSRPALSHSLLASEAFVYLLCALSIFTFFLSCTSQIGIRYLMPCLPFGYVLSGRPWR